MESVLVVGGTGKLGLPVVRKLSADGFDVRVMSRHGSSNQLPASVEFFRGDVADLETVVAAARGMDRVHISLSAGPDRLAIERTESHGVVTLLRALAQNETVKQVSYLSGMYVRAGLSLSPADGAKLAARNAIVRSGIPYTIFRPTYFMDTLPQQVRGDTAIILGKQKRAIRMLAADDFAEMVSRSFRTPLALNKEFDVRGPEAITFDEALLVYARSLGPNLRVKHMSLRLMSIVNALLMKNKLTRELHVMAQMERLGDLPCESDAADVLGPATTTLRAWCELRSQTATNR